MDHNENLNNLRAKLPEIGADAILIARNNSFGNFSRDTATLEYISGFSGSNGRAVISQNKAILSVDGRYIKQAAQQADGKIWEIGMYPELDVFGMIKKLVKKGETLVISPFSSTYKSYLDILKLSDELGFKIKVLDKTPFGENEVSNVKLFLMDENDTGETRLDRINRIKDTLNNKEAVLLTEKSIIGWIFGLRLAKITEDKCVLPVCVALIQKSQKPIIFCDLELTEKTEDFDFIRLDKFKETIKSIDKTIINCDFQTTFVHFPIIMQNNGFSIRQSRVFYGGFEAVKNPVEIRNQKKAAELTSIAFIKALAYSETCERTTEIDVSDLFENELRKNETFIGLSFNTISSFGNNTAMVHYDPKTLGNCKIDSDGLFLFDAGAHFKNSTTDMTRTIYRGDNPSDELKTIYTTLLKSLVMFSTAKFPNKTRACRLDSIARFWVWKEGFDYRFGTGHGVGNFGNVHEHPSISPNSNENITENMTITIEPGIYLKDLGIRIENMVLTKCSDKNPEHIEFETMNFIPFCRKLIKKEMLNASELNWLNNYHKTTYEKFREMFQKDSITSNWLKENTLLI
ncbi:MAG: M24 family metallopeptidase [Holosporales bacterium]|jgi:Xaa-Pro aminopeptidase|nr:M24 family metallopeptidase [Holosporales bacterium]